MIYQNTSLQNMVIYIKMITIQSHAKKEFINAVSNKLIQHRNEVNDE